MKTFQTRMKIKVKTNENQRVSDLSKMRLRKKNIQMRTKIKVKIIENHSVSALSKKRHRNESFPNAEENKSKNY